MAKKTAETKDNSPVQENASPQRKNIDVEKALIENFVALQKIMTNLSASFDNLSGRISKLLDLFEMSAKTLAEKGDSQGDKEIKNKLDSLLEQNKILARGISMIHENSRGSEYSGGEPQESYSPPQTPKGTDGDNYQRSVYSKP